MKFNQRKFDNNAQDENSVCGCRRCRLDRFNRDMAAGILREPPWLPYLCPRCLVESCEGLRDHRKGCDLKRIKDATGINRFVNYNGF